MDSETSAQPPRPAGRTDLVALCQAFNTESALYVVVGGMAMIQQGFLRATEDVDLLLEGSAENVARVRRALEILPDKAIREMDPDDLETYTVVRVADEIVVDLMLKTCGLSFEDARAEIEWREVDGVPIPFASASLLVRMKQTGREKDVLDLRFLEEKLRERG